jgi:hypothetical protein
MAHKSPLHYYLTVVFVLPFICLCCQVDTLAAAKDQRQKKTSTALTEMELQSMLMSYYDRLNNVLGQAFENFESQHPTPKARYIAGTDTAHTIMNALIIAAGPNPSAALVDLIVLTTLGRIIYQEHYRHVFGPAADELVKGFQAAESDIWQIARKVLSSDQQVTFRKTIRSWRQKHPEQFIFTGIRFHALGAERHQAALSEIESSGGIFKSVRQATKEAEKIRLLSERGIFIASRMLMLTEGLMDIWISRQAFHPEVQKAARQFQQIVAISERVTTLAEKLPNLIQQGRQALVKDLVSNERLARDLMGDFRQTITNTQDLVSALETALKEAEPVVNQIYALSTSTGGVDYERVAQGVKDAAQEVTNLLLLLNQTVDTSDLGILLSKAVEAIDRTESETEDLLTHGFLLGCGLILFFFLTLFLYKWAASRMLKGNR